jgi:hypothetical protein
VIESHFEINTITIKVNNQMAIIQLQVGKNTIEDVLLDGGTSVNIITKNLKTTKSSVIGLFDQFIDSLRTAVNYQN